MARYWPFALADSRNIPAKEKKRQIRCLLVRRVKKAAIILSFWERHKCYEMVKTPIVHQWSCDGRCLARFGPKPLRYALATMNQSVTLGQTIDWSHFVQTLNTKLLKQSWVRDWVPAETLETGWLGCPGATEGELREGGYR